MNTIEQERVDVDNGKYSVVIEGGKLSALRHGEPWRDLTGDNLVYWLAVELQQARAQLAQQQEPVAEVDNRVTGYLKWTAYGTLQHLPNGTPLYTASPATAQPAQISDERIEEIWAAVNSSCIPVFAMKFARALLSEVSK